MKFKVSIIILILILLITNGLWWLYLESMKSKNDYHINEVCELREYIYCTETFKKGISFLEFEKIVKKENLSYNEILRKKDTIKVYMKDILEKCPKSGRQYCGINFKFENNKLITIKSGYPCH